MKYQMNQDDLNGFIEFIGIETKTKGKEIVFRYCPRCAGSAPKDDEWKFAINKNTGAFGCLRGSCGYHGHFVELCRDFGYKLGMDAEREYKNFPQPPHKILPRESALAYLADRESAKKRQKGLRLLLLRTSLIFCGCRFTMSMASWFSSSTATWHSRRA